MTGRAADVAVIIVNYGTADLAIAAVDSLRERHHGGRRVEIHIVDNASPDGGAGVLLAARESKGWGEEVILHLEDRNLGFGAGNNVVLRALWARDTPPRFVFLLNPDAQLSNDAIGILARFLEETPRAAAAGAALVSPDGAPMSGAFRFPSILSEIERAANFGPVTRLLSRFRTTLPPDLPRQRVDWVSGAAVMFRLEAMAEIGFFDPAYFLYYEEVDVMRALQRKGWETWFLPEARVVHIEGAATGVAKRAGRTRRPAYVYSSWKHYFHKNHGRFYALSAAILALAGAGLHASASWLRGRESWLPLNYFGDFTGLVLRPLLLDRSDNRSTGQP
jgi:GT2 family glycosyltransferase